jgi:anthranilate synthase component 1
MVEGIKTSAQGKVFYRSLLADWLTPVSAFLKIAGDEERAFLLESVEGGERIGRYSFLGVNPEKTFQGTWREFRAEFPPVLPTHSGLPPFTGGAVGVLSYDVIRELERLPSKHSSDWSASPVLMDFYSTILAFDHAKHQIVILSHEGKEKLDEIEGRLLADHGMERLGFFPTVLTDETRPTLDLQSNFTKEDFCSAVEAAKQYIRAGDIFQVVLSQCFTTDFQGDPFDVYRALRYINPSPYLFFLKMGDVSVAGSSPEMLVRVNGSHLEYRPIAGTRPRGHTAEEELELEKELRADEKEKAEHVMLVDLGRNDLGRVSEYGSVEVKDLLLVEKYSHVMHLVSSLTGRLRRDCDRFDALAACFPAGTVTGAPKVRAMEIIDELEPSPRGVYAGAAGYIDFCGNLDTCIAIRTLVFEKGKVSAQAGAGIVADSVPLREYQECRSKAAALVRALELSEYLGGGR